MRIKKTNAILNRLVNKLFPTEYKYHDTNQTDKAREQKLRRGAAVIGELKRNMTVNYVNIGKEEESSSTANINLLVRFDKTRGIFPSVTRVLSILLTTAATSANAEKVNSKERVLKDSMLDSGYQLCTELSSLQQ